MKKREKKEKLCRHSYEKKDSFCLYYKLYYCSVYIHTYIFYIVMLERYFILENLKLRRNILILFSDTRTCTQHTHTHTKTDATTHAKIGVIGGSGLYNMEGIENVKEVSLDTAFGKPVTTTS